MRNFGIGDSNDYVILERGRVIGRVMLHPHGQRISCGSERSPQWSSAIGLQQGLFSDPRTSDGGFQGALAGLTLLSGFGLAFQLFNVLALLS